MTRFSPRIDILPEHQRAVWPLLAPAKELGFVLYGGTAIALRLGHRQSVDFDFFTDQSLDMDALFEAMPFLKKAVVIQQEPSALTVLVSAKSFAADSVKLSFFGPVRTGRVGAPQRTHDGMLDVASLDDLFATNVKVLLQRIELKDYRDLAAMITAGADLPKALGSARAMYGTSFQPSESLKAMTYFEGGDLEQLSSEDRTALVGAAKAVKTIPEVKIADRRLSIVS